MVSHFDTRSPSVRHTKVTISVSRVSTVWFKIGIAANLKMVMIGPPSCQYIPPLFQPQHNYSRTRPSIPDHAQRLEMFFFLEKSAWVFTHTQNGEYLGTNKGICPHQGAIWVGVSRHNAETGLNFKSSDWPQFFLTCY